MNLFYALRAQNAYNSFTVVVQVRHEIQGKNLINTDNHYTAMIG